MPVTNTIEPPQIIRTQDQPYAFVHVTVPRSEIHSVLPPTLQEVHAALLAQGLPIQPWFAHHLTLRDTDFDFEVCLPVNHSFVATGRVQQGLRPAGTVARATYQGDYPGLPDAWKELHAWITQNGYTHAADIYEHYVVNRHTTQNPNEFRTELSWPLTTKTIESVPA